MYYAILSVLSFITFAIFSFFGIMFAFSLATYRKIDNKLNFTIFTIPIYTPVDRRIDSFEFWLTRNNRLAGVIMIVFSLLDLKLAFALIRLVNN